MARRHAAGDCVYIGRAAHLKNELNYKHIIIERKELELLVEHIAQCFEEDGERGADGRWPHADKVYL